MNRFSVTCCLMLSGGLFAAVASAAEPVAAKLTDRLPYGRPPIDYLSSEVDDPIADLARRLDAGEIEWAEDERLGYLPAVLDALKIPVESQLLVYSKTALNPQFVGPENPRAIYFSDDVSVAHVPGAATIEMFAVDPIKGPVFYELRADGSRPTIERSNRCLACHAGPSTLQVPGWIDRSFVTDETGRPTSGYSRVTHATPIEKRWGGWFVTEFPDRLAHRGNRIVRSDDRTEVEVQFGPEDETASRYITIISDLAAHLVIDHQAHGLNLITRVGFESRLGFRSSAEEELLRYLLFAEEAPLPVAVESRSNFAQSFAERGPFDSHGRSLRQFDLRTRLFRYRLSYLIYSASFDALPRAVKNRLYRRLQEILTAEKPLGEFEHLKREERQAIRNILIETHTDFAAATTARNRE